MHHHCLWCASIYQSNHRPPSNVNARHQQAGRRLCQVHTIVASYDQEAAAAAADAATVSPEALAAGDGSATDRDLEDLVKPACCNSDQRGVLLSAAIWRSVMHQLL